MTLLVWERQSGYGSRAFNLHRRELPPGGSVPGHRHDYHEVFWVDAGVLLHTWDGVEEELVVGDLVALVPGETHVIGSRSGGALVNASFGNLSLAALRTRYGRGLPWPWEGDKAARRRVLSSGSREQLAGLAALVDRTLPHSRDLFILGLLHVLARAASPLAARLPVPIQHAMRELVESDGRPTAARLAQRLRCSREHLSRSVRRLTGQGLAALLRDLRLQAAEERLLRGEAPAVVAAAAGFASLSGFYDAFRRRRGQSPQRWRRAALSPGGPGPGGGRIR